MSDKPPEPPIVIPFSQHPLLKTRDLDEARQLAGRLYGAVDVGTAPGRSDFSWSVNRAALGAVKLAAGWLPDGGHIDIRSGGDQYVVSLARRGSSDARCAGTEATIAPGRSGMIVSPHLPARSQFSDGFATLTVVVERTALEAHFCRLTQVPLQKPLRFVPGLDLSTGRGAGLLRLLEFLVTELEQGDGLQASPLARASLDDALLTALLTCAPHDHSHVLTAPRLQVLPGYVRRAEAYMEAHAGEPLTLPSIAAAAGVSVRALQAAFRQHRGSSPRDFLRDRRLSRARGRLLSSDPGTTVAAAAAAAGYSHLGRFSADYKRRFGETPRDTLRRGHGDPAV